MFYSVTFTKHYFLRSYNYPPCSVEYIVSVSFHNRYRINFYIPVTFSVFNSLSCVISCFLSHFYFYRPPLSFPSFLSLTSPFFSPVLLPLSYSPAISSHFSSLRPATVYYLPHFISPFLSLPSFPSSVLTPLHSLLSQWTCSLSFVSSP